MTQILLEVDILCGMVVHCVGIPAAPLVGVDHVLRDIEVERDDSLIFVDEDIFSCEQDFESVRTSFHSCSLVDECVVCVVGVLTTVHTCTCDEHIEEGVGILIVAYPACSCNIEVAGISVGEVSSPLLVLELNVDSEVLNPASLDELCNLLVSIVCVVEQTELGETYAVGVTCFSKELLCVLRIKLSFAEARIAGHIRYDTPAGELTTLSD